MRLLALDWRLLDKESGLTLRLLQGLALLILSHSTCISERIGRFWDIASIEVALVIDLGGRVTLAKLHRSQTLRY